ncbi:pyridoxamine 5'-phosphate oxidase family protein [uncultured Methanospirillum sp.]|uniref:pyridoxamine 5'-phosphate oxidase family protein n=1 Tax=uncultured Methanospirillum sp. TaxID=262503 RepID=UPI0029C8B19B|nr:pyridoxamine 5'-phosphate oxidase family protein [uncultured Methanospirillum sp.]
MTTQESIDTVVDFIKPGSTVYVATVDGTTPHVRPFQFQFEQDGKLWFCTANTKEVFAQITKNPEMEFTFLSPEYVTMRVNGSVVINENALIKEKIIAENELVRSIYKEVSNPVFSVFYMEHGDVRISYLTGDPDKRFTF